MKRQVFFSFHYAQDSRRAAEIRNIGIFEGNKSVSDNEWETVKQGGNTAIQHWIDDNLQYRSCLIVLIGEYTAERKWVRYEIQQAWNKRMGVLGIYIDHIKDPLLCRQGYSGYSAKGSNPFDKIHFTNGLQMSSVVPCYEPNPYDAYNSIAMHIEQWIETAIQIRNKFL